MVLFESTHVVVLLVLSFLVVEVDLLVTLLKERLN